jgi:hypothetical protein
MKMITKAIEQKLPALYSTEEVPTDEKKGIVKFFMPWGSWTWYAVEGSKQEDGDWLFFGFVEGQEKEWGYFVLSELTSVKGPFGLKIERDLSYNGKIPTQ